jgi:hypothetical protein
MSLTSLTTEETRRLRDYLPSLSNRPDGNVDLATKLQSMIDEQNAVEILQGTVADGDTTVVVTVAGGDAQTAKLLCNLAFPVGDAERIASVEATSATEVTVTIDQDPGADTCLVTLLVDHR